MPDLLDRIRRELDDRMTALRPAADEFQRLQRAADALDQIGPPPAAPAAERAAAPRPRPRRRAPARAAARPAPARRRRSARSGSDRAAPGQTQLRVIDQLRAVPGSTSTAVAQALGISANAAAATISRLVKQGRVQRLQTGGYGAAEQPAPTVEAPASPPDVPGS